jgi:hypothetical protein
MKARVAHGYGDLDKKHFYYIDNTHFWVWYGLGETLNKDVNLYPFIPSWKPVKGRTITARDYHTLGLRCGRQLMKYFNKYGK